MAAVSVKQAPVEIPNPLGAEPLRAQPQRLYDVEESGRHIGAELKSRKRKSRRRNRVQFRVLNVNVPMPSRLQAGGERMLQSSAIAVRIGRAGASQDLAEPSSIVETVRLVLAVPDHQLDYARAKLTFDRLVEPSVDIEAALRQIDEMAEAAGRMSAGAVTVEAKLSALRRFLHEPGPWNDHRPFAYDQRDPLGRSMPNKLLHNYIGNRLGQCVSMPALFLILAERVGLEASFGMAPEHVFVRVNLNGRSINIETTSGGHPARDAWYRQKFPITDRSIQAGIYLRSLSRREAVAVMASIVVEHLYKAGRYADVVAVTGVILGHYPLEINAMLARGSACGKLLTQLQLRYPTPGSAPPEVATRMRDLMHRNMAAFSTAENLGWVPFDEGRTNAH